MDYFTSKYIQNKSDTETIYDDPNDPVNPTIKLEIQRQINLHKIEELKAELKALKVEQYFYEQHLQLKNKIEERIAHDERRKTKITPIRIWEKFKNYFKKTL